MTEQNDLHFEQFYFGNLIVGESRVSTTMGVVARTPTITPEHATECVQLAKLRPPMPGEASDAMPCALGLFRGNNQSADFIFAKAQRNTAGLSQVLYLFVPSSALRALSGNVRTFYNLGMADMPAFKQVNKRLHHFELPNAVPPSPETQTEALMDLLIYCQDSFSAVEGLLSAVVLGWPVAITNSPPDLDKRLQFLQGLLSLLPAPARSGITFATHVSDFKTGQVQVKFSSKPDVPEQHVVFDWQAGEMRSPTPEHAYSHYILAQLRLDPSRVIQETERLAHTAVWRAMHRENLGQALEWVSRRAALDQTVRNGQPADRDLVARVLHEDPTLPDDMRAVYVRHVLAFALALKEAASADVVAAQCATHPHLTPKVIEQLQTALDNNQPHFIFTILERWILRVPEASPSQWHTLLHTAAESHLAGLLKAGQVKRAQRFLAYLHKAPDALQMDDTMRDIVITASDSAQLTPDLAQQVFLFGAEFLKASELQELLANAHFVAQLPEPLQEVLTYLQSGPTSDPSPDHMLHHAAHVFGSDYRMLVLTRLVELAVQLERTELIDTPAVQALLVMTQSPRSDQFYALVQRVIDNLVELENLRRLTPPGPRILIQLMLQSHDYEHAVAMLEYYQNTIFGTDNLDDFNMVVSELFSQVTLPPEDLTTALAHFENSQIRPKVRAMVYASSLTNHDWSGEIDYAAQQLTTIIYNDYTIISAIGREHMLRLLEYHARPHNASDALRVAAGLIDHMTHIDTDDASLIPRMWPLITWDDEITSMTVELLRRYVRNLPMRKVPKLIQYLGDELGQEIEDILQATYIMRFITDDAGMLEAAGVIHTAAELLTDIATTYHSTKELPTLTRLRRELDTMTGGLSNDERFEVADNLLTVASEVYSLGTRYTRHWNKPAEIEPLVQGKLAPQNSGELLYFIGGHFGQRQAHPIELNREEMAHLFGTRSAAMFRREVTVITRLLQRLQQASRQLEHIQLSPTALRAELNSLWDTLSLYNKRQLQPQLARDCQQLPGVIEVIARNTNERAIGNTGITRQLETGRRQPQSALETLRWIHGYFARKHVR